MKNPPPLLNKIIIPHYQRSANKHINNEQQRKMASKQVNISARRIISRGKKIDQSADFIFP